MDFPFPLIPLCLLNAVLVSSELFHFNLFQGNLVSLVFSRLLRIEMLLVLIDISIVNIVWYYMLFLSWGFPFFF